jgi:hypothetical protein
MKMPVLARTSLLSAPANRRTEPALLARLRQVHERVLAQAALSDAARARIVREIAKACTMLAGEFKFAARPEPAAAELAFAPAEDEAISSDDNLHQLAEDLRELEKDWGRYIRGAAAA